MASTMARAMASSCGARRASSSCHRRCSCRDSPAESANSCCRSSSSPVHGVSADPTLRSPQPSSRISTVFSVGGRSGSEVSAGGGLTSTFCGGLGLLVRLEHDVALEKFADMRLKLERGQLEESDGLLQLRGHRQLLTQPELQRRFQHGGGREKLILSLKSRYRRNDSPKYTSRTWGLARISSADPAAITVP